VAQGWCTEMTRGGRGAASSFAWRNFLSQPSLQMAHDTRQQLRKVGTGARACEGGGHWSQ
jgi:hypothetical protein